ncbi:MAG TPA: hypothetical protein VN033_12535 [Vulgatibacter sp.]|nr:hypothetical protein [Vulgatibacter sp.]
MIQPQYDKLLAWASAPERQNELLSAKADFFVRTGEAHEEDRSFETRLALFVEYYLFDRNMDGLDLPPAKAFLEQNAAAILPEEEEGFEALGRTIHGVFEVRKLGTRIGLLVRELLSDEAYEVLERRGLVALNKGDILEARLIPVDGNHVFTGNFLYHPPEARKAILKEAKRRRKVGADAAASRDFAHELARLALKLERYRSVPVENIYRFE